MGIITVKFANGQEKQFDGEAATLTGPLFVLYKRRGRKLESADTFPADQIAWARLEKSGTIVVGGGIIKS